MNTFTQTQTYTHLHICGHTYIRTYVHTCICTYVHMYIRIRIMLDEDALCNYRHISNLPTLSQLEKVIARRFNIHLDMNTLCEPL